MALAATAALDLKAASLFDVDPELAERLDPRQRAEARGRAIVAVVDLPPGPWSPEPIRDAAARPFGFMVVDGLLLRELLLAGSTATELIGPCDIVATGPTDDALLPTNVQWSVPQAARVVVLDDRVIQILRTWPSVGRVLLHRAARREARLSVHRAIAQLPRVDQRLLAFFAHLSERWGRVAASGVVLPMHLTHETLGRLIGARRPTVSLALKDLAGDGLLQRRNDGSWLLRYEAFERLGAESAVPERWQAADAHPVEAAVAAPDGARDRTRRPAGMSPEDIADLHARVERLRALHPKRVSQCATVLERSREVRLAFDRRAVNGRVSGGT
jgi:CRP/FNR family transcriptional regulator, cyclic AMP receptor protein